MRSSRGKEVFGIGVGQIWEVSDLQQTFVRTAGLATFLLSYGHPAFGETGGRCDLFWSLSDLRRSRNRSTMSWGEHEATWEDERRRQRPEW